MKLIAVCSCRKCGCDFQLDGEHRETKISCPNCGNRMDANHADEVRDVLSTFDKAQTEVNGISVSFTLSGKE